MFPQRSARPLSLLSLLAIVALLLMQAPGAVAQSNPPIPPGLTAEPLPDDAFLGTVESPVAKYSFADSEYLSYLVRSTAAPLATYDGSIAGLAATSPQVTGSPLDLNSPAGQAYLAYLNEQLDIFTAQLTQAIPGLRVTHRFDIVLGGLAVQVPRRLADRLAILPGVQAVLPDQLQQLDTTRSAEFIGAPTAWHRLGGVDRAGEGVVVGILDSGIWPESPSFADPDPAGVSYPHPPPRGDATLWPCDFSAGTNPGHPAHCNNKLISAQRFMATYDQVVGLKPYEFTSARDDDGHGTHTASTAAGNYGVPVALAGNHLGPISGIAPRAHVAAYKVCGQLGCFTSDSVAAIQQAIVDGVDVLNFSISGGADPYEDVVGRAFLDAYNAGIFVAASAGNNGPTAESVEHRAPWITTVGASSHDRTTISSVKLASAAGDYLTLRGASIGAGIVSPAPVVVNTGDPLCQRQAEAGSFAGKIVVCARGVNQRVSKSVNVAAGGAVGMLLFNNAPLGTNTDLHPIPTVHLEGGPGSDAERLLAFLELHSAVTATFSRGEPAEVQGDILAGFSARGGPEQSLGISKPDLVAPGVNILAGFTGSEFGAATPIFSFQSGTSMSSPQVAGAGALLRAIYPDWTPGQIKSALMTTAGVADLVKEDGKTPTTSFDTGSGRVDLSRAWNPGLTFDERGERYLALRNELWNANYPSLFIPRLPGIMSVNRSVTNVSATAGTWRLAVEYPEEHKDFAVHIPATLKLDPGQTETFLILIDARDVPLNATRFAALLLTGEDGHTTLRFPISFVRRPADLDVGTTCEPAVLDLGETTRCTVTITNVNTDDTVIALATWLPRKLAVLPGSVRGGRAIGQFQVVYTGRLPAQQPVDVQAKIDPRAAPFGYVGLRVFPTVQPVEGTGDETLSTFDLPLPIRFGGISYDRIGVVSNGYIILGGGTPTDIESINTAMPNPARPNNVLAPFWTDLDATQSRGGAIRVATLTSGSDQWLVVDFDQVPNASDSAARNSFQAWISLTRPDDVSFAYDTVTDGEGGFVTIGAENNEGSRGATIWLNGAPAANKPTPTNTTDYAVAVRATPGRSSSHSVTFEARGRIEGHYAIDSFLLSSRLDGITVGRFSGMIRPAH